MDRRRELVVVAALAVVGAGLFGAFYGTFPTSSPPIKHDRTDALATANDFLRTQGYDVSGFQGSAAYGGNDTESVYIQRTVPRDRVGDTLREYRVRHWTVSYVRPTEQERFAVAVDPVSGEVVGFDHRVPDGAGGGTLPTADARARAEQFLAERGHDLGEYELVTNATTERANRTDHTFVWRHESRGVGAAPYEVRVTLHGDRIGGYEAGLSVPDRFVHGYQVTQSYSLLPTVLFFLLSGVFGVFALYYGLRYYKAETFDWRYALAAGGFVAVLTLVGTANSLPGLRGLLPSTIAPWLFWTVLAVAALVAAAVQGGITFVAAGTGKRLAREVLDRTPVDRVSTIRRDPAVRDDVAYSLTRGFLLAFALLGFYTVFYVVGTAFFNVWLPVTDPNASAFSAAVPAVSALVVGGVAAVWEETAYRLFAVPLCKRHLKYTAVALVVPAFVWGLGHAGYAVLPVWARVVETTLLGVILGYAFLRWDVVTTVAAHFTVNATIVASAMLAAGGSLLVHGVLSAGVAALPLLVGLGLLATDPGAAGEPGGDDPRRHQ